MRAFTRSELKSLVDAEDHRCVSLYLPTATAGVETLENPVQLKKQLKEAKARLAQSGLRENAADAILQPATDLIGEYPFWQLQDEGLALFLSSGFFAGYRLPFPVASRTVVTNGFHLKPLLRLLADDHRFFILAVSRKAVRLFRAGRYNIEEVFLPEVVTSQAEALKYDDPEKSLQVHPGQPGSITGQHTAIVHGHGAAREDSKERTLRFFQRMSNGLRTHLQEEPLPLLLASVDYYLPLLRKAINHPQLVDAVLSGNPDDTPPEVLRERGWSLLAPRFAGQRLQSRKAVELGLTQTRATSDLAQGVAAACHGRAEKCFVALDHECWGEFDQGTSEIRRLAPDHFESRDLLDLAAVQTVLQGGEVYPEEKTENVPGPGPLAVLLRY